ncbi:hypothetical protein AB0C27_40415 [Nonomuraea sp. NPDC048882]|uniref:hypothetical protein n=1 Tax=Nonomuraea sp. NPDC048882 TaxID=3154347 RepID=UPI0033CA1451
MTDRPDHDIRASLYTTIENDHSDHWASQEPCDCESGGTMWERNGKAWRPNKR